VAFKLQVNNSGAGKSEDEMSFYPMPTLPGCFAKALAAYLNPFFGPHVGQKLQNLKIFCLPQRYFSLELSKILFLNNPNS
jgi:hypothetical protein